MLYPALCYTIEIVQMEISPFYKNGLYYCPEVKFFYLEIDQIVYRFGMGIFLSIALSFPLTVTI